MLTVFNLLAVRLVSTRISTNTEVAIKILHLESVRDELDNIQKEISLLSRLDSPYVVQYLGSFLDGTDLNVVMEYMAGGSLRDLMKAGPLQEAEISATLREVLSGLVFLHAAKVVHRDIKAANILMNDNGKVKIADFGVARELNASKRRFSVVGSPYWMAPEVITAKDGGLYNEKADIWSLGISAIELAKGFPPRSTEKPMKVLVSIPTSPPPRLDGPFSAVFKDFVATCLQIDAIKRPSAKELLSHPFIAQSKDTTTLPHIIERFKAWCAAHPNAASATTPLGPSEKIMVPNKIPPSLAQSGTPSPTDSAGSTPSKQRNAPFKKTSVEKLRLQNAGLETSSDSLDDWDLSSTTKTGSPDSSAPSSPKKTTTGLQQSQPVPAQQRRPGPSAIKRPAEFSTLSASTDENQFGSVIVHQTSTDGSDASSGANAPQKTSDPARARGEGAGEEDDGSASVSMTEQQFGSVVIKTVKNKEPASPPSSARSVPPSTQPDPSTPATTGSKKVSAHSTPTASNSGKLEKAPKSPTAVTPKSNGTASTSSNITGTIQASGAVHSTDSKPLKRDKSNSKISDPPTSATQATGTPSTLSTSSPAQVSSTDASNTAVPSKRPKSSERVTTTAATFTSSSMKERKKTDAKDKEVKDTKTKRKPKTSTPAAVASELTLTNTESAAVLNNVLLPVLAKRASSDKLAQLMSLLTALEAESPGFAQEFTVDLVKKVEHEQQRSLPPLGIQVVVNSTRDDYSDLTKYLLTRWRAKTDVPTASTASDEESAYFM